MLSSIRYLALTLAGLAACSGATRPTAGPGAGQPPPLPQAPNRELRVMTYNIKHGQSNAACAPAPVGPGQPPSADCNLDVQGTIGVIRAQAPDIVAVQEVDRFWARSAYADEVMVIAGGLQMAHHCFAPNLDHAPDTHSNRPHQYGTAIFSRFPIISCANTLLTTFAGWEQRGILGAVINVRDLPTRVYSTHLQASSNVGGVSQSGAPQRVLQVQDIMRLLAEGSSPIVLMGDFNAGSTSDELAPLYTRLRDVWREAGAGPGNTVSARLSGDPTGRIDYIFISPGIAISSVSVPIDAQTRLASDHYPVVANIAVPESQPGPGLVACLWMAAARAAGGREGARTIVLVNHQPFAIHMPIEIAGVAAVVTRLTYAAELSRGRRQRDRPRLHEADSRDIRPERAGA